MQPMTKFVLPAVLFCSTLGLQASDDTGSNATSVAVEIDGTKLTLGDFEQKQAANLFQARNAFYQAERKALDDYINQYVVEQQAKKENLTVDQLFEKHVTSLLPKDPSENELRVFYEGIDAKEPYEAMRSQIIDNIRQRRLAKAKIAYIQMLRSEANVVLRLGPPRAYVSLKDAPVRGPENARVTIVEYADYECPYCQRVQPELDKLEADYKGKIAVAYKDVPLPMHPHAEKTAEAAHCAGEQGKYWQYHDLLFTNKQLDISNLKEDALTLKLDAKKFDECLDSGAEAKVVSTNLAEGNALQIQGTPSFLINGRFYSGVLSYDQLKSIVDEELQAPAATQASTR